MIHAGSGKDFVYGFAGNDTLYADSGENYIYGGIGDDKIYGSSGSLSRPLNWPSQTPEGWEGTYAGNGTDHLYGEAGNDTIYGGFANGEIFGGPQTDYLMEATARIPSAVMMAMIIYGRVMENKPSPAMPASIYSNNGQLRRKR